MDLFTVAYAPEDNYVGITIISMISVLENNPKNNIEFIILNNNLNERSVKKFEYLKKYKNYSIKFVHVDNTIFKNFPTVNWVTTSAWYRTKIADLCPECNKVLYLDSDTLVLTPLDELFSLNLGDNYVGAVAPLPPTCIKLKSNKYFNSGVLLINCEIWRTENVFDKILNYVIKNNKNIKCADQDVLNTICDERKFYLPEEYNYCESHRTLDFEINNNAKIVHFVGPNPNRFDCVNSYKNKWLEYAINTPFYDEFVNQNIYNLIKFYPKLMFDDFKFSFLAKDTKGKIQERYKTKSILLKQLLDTLKY